MLIYTRETILTRLMAVADVASLYQTQGSDFVGAVLAWMTATEQDLLRLRHPLASLCGSQRAQILACMDGARPAGVDSAFSARKAIRAATALCLGQVEQALRTHVGELDVRLQDAMEKMAQLLALGVTQGGLPSPEGLSRSAWIRLVWQYLGEVQQTRNLHSYLAGRFSFADREAVLDETLRNMGAG